MKLTLHPNDPAAYLAETAIIDYTQPAISALAQQLAQGLATEQDSASAFYRYVRDEIAHSFDIEGKTVTCSASETLQAREGLCFAKSHLLAALMRHQGIPCGFCYQLIWLNEEFKTLVLHGLNAIYLKSLNKWIRVDARGNKEGVDAQFSVEKEQLAYPADHKRLQEDYPIIFAQPDPNVIAALTNNKTIEQLRLNLPHVLAQGTTVTEVNPV